jgi:chemotaxis signal transduction protein
VVDAVSQVRRLASKSIRPLPSEVPTAGREFLMAVAPGASKENDLLLILDTEKIFNLDEQSALASVP